MVIISFFMHLLFFVYVVLFSKKQIKSYSPFTIYLVFHFVVFIIRPFLVFFCGFGKFDYIGFVPNDADFIRVLFIVDIFLLFFMLPFVLYSRKNLDVDVNCKNYSLSGIWFFWILFVLLMPIIMTSFGLQQTVSQFHDDNGLFIQNEVSGYLWDAKNMLFGFVVLSFVVFRNKYIQYLLVVVYISLNLYVASGRWLVIIAIGFIFLHKLISGNVRVNLKLIIGIIPFLVVCIYLFLLLSNNRLFYSDLVDGSNFNAVDFSIKEKLDTLDFANFDFLTFITSVIPDKTHTYRYGVQYLSLLSNWVPRFMWPDKPIGDLYSFYDLNIYGNFIALTYSIVGDGWSNFGYIGVIINAIFFGLFLNFLLLAFEKSNNDFFKVFYISFVPLLLIFYRDGGVSIIRLSIMTYLPILLYLLLMKVFRSEYN